MPLIVLPDGSTPKNPPGAPAAPLVPFVPFLPFAPFDPFLPFLPFLPAGPVVFHDTLRSLRLHFVREVTMRNDPPRVFTQAYSVAASACGAATNAVVSSAAAATSTVVARRVIPLDIGRSSGVVGGSGAVGRHAALAGILGWASARRPSISGRGIVAAASGGVNRGMTRFAPPSEERPAAALASSADVGSSDVVVQVRGMPFHKDAGPIEREEAQ
ncbi:MAG TPA: hypothetical protein VLT58_10065 [Polyangia bacterium]|nr:hypothetical protein [Polyangia bacterium]